MKIFLILAAVSAALAAPEIDPALQNLASGAKVNIMVTISNRTDAVLEGLVQTLVGASRNDRLNAVHDALLAHATLTQAAVMAALAPFGSAITSTSFWITNQISVKGANSLVIQALSLLPSVAKIEAEFFIQIPSSTGAGFNATAPAANTTTYGVAKIMADAVWALGFNGAGVVVANIDTGVRLTHKALAGRFIGDFGWYDPTYASTSPNDKQGHGTHTMGSMTGTGGIGVAPGARWAACMGCPDGSCSSTALTACGQFFACPTKGGFFGFFPTKDCTKAPHVINNSWGGAGNSSWYNAVIKAWNAAGMTGVFSAGNNGPACNTVQSPSDQNGTISVGATDANDRLAPYSSVGPVGNGLLKPDLVGPGSDVISAWATSDNQFWSMNGTSMSGPHVAGVVALMKSKNKNLTFTQIYNALTGTCDQSTLVGAGQTCGGKTDSMWPNYSFGYGRVNALKAFQAI